MISCGEKETKSRKETRIDEDNHFADTGVEMELDSLKNELADGNSDFSKSFGQDEIAWQKWNPSLLEKAKLTQSPIFALVGSTVGGTSRSVGKELTETPNLRKLLTERYVCTVIDTHIYPEIELLCYQLAREMKRATTFPFFIWLTHEGIPLNWMPIGAQSGRELEMTLEHATSMIEDSWVNYSKDTIIHSRIENERRQERFESAPHQVETTPAREETFRSSTRHLSSLYRFGDQDLDYIGGLTPTNSLELLALGSNSHLLTDEVRKRCHNAASEVANALIKEALKDHLNGSYFFARRTTDWSLPAFSKTIASQAEIAHMLIRLGTIFNNDLFLEEGLSVLSITEEAWLQQSLSSISPTESSTESPDDPGKYLWDLKSLEKTLTEEEVTLALSAFSMTPKGNIPAAADPLEEFYTLNTLRQSLSLSELANQIGQSNTQLSEKLEIIKKKLLTHREKNTSYERESTLTVTDLALVLKAQLARAGHLKERHHLKPAIILAERISQEFYHPQKGLTRFPHSKNPIPARCQDYANTANAFFLLNQATLEVKWLTLALKILDEAITTLISENGLLSEISDDERIIPLRQNNRSMIFGESSLGVLDLSLNRAWAITGDEKYRVILDAHTESLTPLVKRSTVNHTDYLTSCALGTHPLVAVMKGDPAQANGYELLATLNSQKHLPYLTIRTAKPSDTQLGHSDSALETSITLLRNGKVLGRATQPQDLEKILARIITGK